MNVIILTEGGAGRGFGQVARCAALAWAFRERGYTTELMIRGEESVLPLVRGLDIAFDDWLRFQSATASKISSSRIVVMDSYQAPCSFYEMVADAVPTALYFDDTRRLEYPRGYVVNGAFDAESIAYPPNKNIRYLLGIQYFPLRRECWDLPPRTVAPRVTTALITFGGSDEKCMTLNILEFLKDFRPDLKKIVIVGKGFSHQDEIRSVTDKRTQLLADPDGSSMKAAMLASDIAISAAGQTLYELLRSGLPTIAVQVIDNQADNVRGLTRAAAIGFAGLAEDSLTLQNIAAFLAAWDAPDDRQALADRGQALIDGRGCRRIVETILDGSP